MGSLEESRCTIEALTAERNYYKEFWQAMNNYHSIISHFQVPAPTMAMPGPFPSQNALPPINAIAPFHTTAFPVSSHQGEHPQPNPAQPPAVRSITEYASAPPVSPNTAPTKDVPILSTPKAAALTSTQSPETPSKRTIQSYFTPVKKPVAPPAPPRDSVLVVVPRPAEVDRPPTPAKEDLTLAIVVSDPAEVDPPPPPHNELPSIDSEPASFDPD
jgi:hypothetical protein